MKKLLPLFISAALGSMSTSAWADSLTEIYDLAKQNDPQLLSAAAQRDAAFEAITSSRSALLPQINLTAGYNLTRGDTDLDSVRNNRSNDKNTLSAGVALSQELYNRTSWITLDIAEKTAREADASYAATQQGLILRVSQAYFEVLRAQDNLGFVRAEKAAVGRQLEQTKQRFEVGLSAITDVYDAQAQYDSVLANEILAQNDLLNSYEAIREITGQEPKTLDQLDTKRFSASPSNTPINALIDEAKSKNLSLLSTRIAQDIARENIALASSGHLPTLSLDGGYNYADISQSDDSDGTTNNFNVGVNLAVPLYTGGKITSLTKQAEFNYVSASENLEKEYRSVVSNVRAQNNNINASIGALKAYEQTVISAKAALEATEAGFDVGTRTIVDVLDSTQSLYNANKNLSDARYNYILSVLQLRQAVGTLSEQDILDIDAGLKPAS
ncbi:outer membrane channel protein TolC [Vibrio sp. PID17_43]|uniref:outer membrane channel protein TolC n=1 Tax=Vibrio sp. PID17_43 TaxID=1583451 RepID=UPI000BFFD7D4|nr:outer membrane channel protein TolC [Vibrio sp. PID17_43]PHJ42358.1 outer membrane channel protein [Vibrio sp. PID17_43]